MSTTAAAVDARQRAATHLAQQAVACRRLGSPFYGSLLEILASDCEAGGVTWSVLDGYEGNPVASALALKFLGAVHRLVLEGRAPELARYYPSAGGTSTDGQQVWPVFRDVVATYQDELRDLARRPVQTNEVARSASLLGGFLTIARATGLPLRLLEIGASAGLNLRWDRYWYESAGGTWGDPGSAVRFRAVFDGVHPRFDTTVTIATRLGCDARPLDPSSEEARLTLRSYLWPDQTERFARLNSALEMAARVPAIVEQADARKWLESQLIHAVPGSVSVVFHSIVMQYLGREGASRIAQIISAAGDRATPSAPLAWLRLEPAKGPDGDWEFRVSLTMWPGGEERVLALTSPHGPPVQWRG